MTERKHQFPVEGKADDGLEYIDVRNVKVSVEDDRVFSISYEDGDSISAFYLTEKQAQKLRDDLQRALA